MNIRKFISVIISIIFCMIVSSGCLPQTADKIKIGIIQFTQYPTLDAVRQGFTKRMRELGYIDGVNSEFDYKSANGSFEEANEIIDNYIEDKKDIIISISTPATTVAAKAADKIPVVFAAVSDPVGAGIVDSLESTGRNITGTSNVIRIKENLDLAFQLTPNIKKLGFIYNPAEQNSIKSLEGIKEYLKDKDVELIETTVNSPAEVPAAAQELIQKVDSIFVPNDNTVAAVMPIIAKMAIDAKIPAYVGLELMVQENGLANVGIRYETMGKEAANMAAEILGGEKQAKDIPVEILSDDLYTFINIDTAKKIDLIIPDKILGAPKTVLYTAPR